MQDCWTVTQSTCTHIELLLDLVLQVRRHTPRSAAVGRGYARCAQNVAELGSQTIIIHCSNGLCQQTALVIEFLMRNPRDFDDVLLLHGPPARHIQEVAQAVQIALDSGIHLVLLHEGHDRTLGTTADGAAHLESRASRSRGLE